MDVKFFSNIEVGTTEGKKGRFMARICTFGVVDRGGDVVHPGAFAASLARCRARKLPIKVLWNHDHDDPNNIIGRVSPHDCEETAEGLVVAGELYLGEERGMKVYRELERGVLSEWSFGCIVDKARPRTDRGRDLLALDLFEVSPTIIGKGVTETLMVSSAAASKPSSRLTPVELRAPYQARFDVIRQRIARRRA